ncbi:alpha/beta fold hydrolase [Streptomyces sp. NPDC050121]
MTILFRWNEQACPHVRMVTVADAGHLLLVEQPAVVAEIVAEAATASVR